MYFSFRRNITINVNNRVINIRGLTGGRKLLRTMYRSSRGRSHSEFVGLTFTLESFANG
jgi:hypothetical protein